MIYSGHSRSEYFILKDLTGQPHGWWRVLRFSHTERAKSAGKRATPNLIYFWLCECTAPQDDGNVCGKVQPVRANNLRGDQGSTNCGCLHPRNHKHGMSQHPAWFSWHAMRQRCNNPNAEGYHLYGGRGIKVCDRWNNSFEAFWEDVGATWFKGGSTDRYPDNDGNYEPGNFRWATPKQQAENRRTNRPIPTPEGPMIVTKAAERFGFDPRTIFGRIHYGWADEDLLLPVSETHDGLGRFAPAPGRKAPGPAE